MIKQKGSTDTNEEKNASVEKTDKVPLSHYKDILLSSIWLIGAFGVVSMGIAFLLTKLIRPTYLATTTIMVSKANLGMASTYDTVWTGEKLASTYAGMLTSVNILEQVKPLINSSISTEDLKNAINVFPILNSQLIEINVEYSDAALAVKIANQLVNVFSSEIKKSQMELITNQEDASKALLQDTVSEIARLQEKLKGETVQLYNQRLDTINKSITDIRNQIGQINQEMAPLLLKTTLTSSEQLTLSNYEAQKADLNALLTQYQIQLATITVRGPTLDSGDFESNQDAALLDQSQRLYSSLLLGYQDLNRATIQNMVTVTQIDQPVLPESPIRPKLMINLILGLVVGLLLSVLYLFFFNIDGGDQKKTKSK
jgi:capsular polysaccharide biosynthesis protein